MLVQHKLRLPIDAFQFFESNTKTGFQLNIIPRDDPQQHITQYDVGNPYEDTNVKIYETDKVFLHAKTESVNLFLPTNIKEYVDIDRVKLYKLIIGTYLPLNKDHNYVLTDNTILNINGTYIIINLPEYVKQLKIEPSSVSVLPTYIQFEATRNESQ